MPALKNYIGSLSAEDMAVLCDITGISEATYRKLAKSNSSPGVKACVLLEQFSGGEITRKELRTDWEEIWPELDI